MKRGMLQTLRPLWPYLWRYRGNFAWGLAALALKDLAAVSAPLVIRAAVDRMARATNDLNAVRMMLGPGVMYWTETSLTFVLAIAVMASTDWRLTLLAILPAPLVSFAVIFFGRKIHDRFERIQAMFSDISSRVQENLAGVRMVRAYAQEAAELKKFNALNVDYIGQNIQLVRISGLFEPLLELFLGS